MCERLCWTLGAGLAVGLLWVVGCVPPGPGSTPNTLQGSPGAADGKPVLKPTFSDKPSNTPVEDTKTKAGTRPPPPPPPERYPRAELLMDVESLKAELSNPRLRILDCRPLAEYRVAHVSGAVHVDHAAWEAAAQKPDSWDGPTASADWAERIAALGIDNETTVVVIDDCDRVDAARIWWLLRYWGLRDVRLLDGGWAAWREAALPVISTPVMAPRRTFVPAPQADRRLTGEQLANRLGRVPMCVLDARSPREFAGLDVRSARGGHIPNALNLEWRELIDPKRGGRFRPPAAMREMLNRAGLLDSKVPVAVYCQGGGRASVVVFALESMGRDSVTNYYFGWSDWGNDSARPVQTAPPTGAGSPK